jgi:flavodoxin
MKNKKYIVVYFSNTGNNKYLAHKMAQTLNCDMEAIRPRVKKLFLILLLGKLKMSPGIKAIKHDLKNYDMIILCGPVWMGQFVSPLYDFLKKHTTHINKLYFVCCCGSSDEERNSKFGHGHVFREVKEMMGKTCVLCEALPITLVLPEDKMKDSETVMKTRLTDQNFKGEMESRFNRLMGKISE